MVRKTTGPAKKAAAGGKDLEKRLIDAAFGLAAEEGWRNLTLSRIADRAGMTLAETATVACRKDRILTLFRQRMDEATLAAVDPQDGDAPARDRLFDVIMLRLEKLQPYRPGLTRILADTACDPLSGLCMLLALRSSVAVLLEAAGLATGGVRGFLRIEALGCVYLITLRTWLRDESPDLSKTMAQLDRQLGRLDRLAGFCSRMQKKDLRESPA